MCVSIFTYHSAQPPRDFLCERRIIFLVYLRAERHGRIRVLHIACESGGLVALTHVRRGHSWRLFPTLASSLAQFNTRVRPFGRHCPTICTSQHHRANTREIRCDHNKEPYRQQSPSAIDLHHETCARRPPASQARPFRETSFTPFLLRLGRQEHLPWSMRNTRVRSVWRMRMCTWRWKGASHR
jgi:hypothetical protein